MRVGLCERGRPTFFEQDTFEQGVLVAQHQAFISGATMILLKGLQGVFIALNGGLELADVLCATLTEGSLGLAVALLPLLRGSIDLTAGVSFMSGKGMESRVQIDNKIDKGLEEGMGDKVQMEEISKRGQQGMEGCDRTIRMNNRDDK